MRPDAFAWADAYLPNTAPTSAIAQHYHNPANRLTLFDATQEQRSQTTWVPGYPMLPMEVVLKVATTNMAPPRTV